MFSLLGIKNLRIGGNTSDTGTLPSQPDITAALDFANAANLKLIYGLRLKTFDPAGSAATANFILNSNPTGLVCFAVGNEPDLYLSGYPAYKSDAQAYFSAISDPRAKFCGPDVAGASSWVVSYATDFAPGGRIALADRHNYFGGNGQSISASAARDLPWCTRRRLARRLSSTRPVARHSPLPRSASLAAFFGNPEKQNGADAAPASRRSPRYGLPGC